MAFFEGIKMTGGYGNGPDIISSCSVNVNKGEIVSILGPNGAGKSTAMKAMLGLLNLKSGKIIINGKDISHLNPQDRVKQGVSFVPQTKNVFAELTVRENLEIGGFLRKDGLEKMIKHYNKYYISSIISSSISYCIYYMLYVGHSLYYYCLKPIHIYLLGITVYKHLCQNVSSSSSSSSSRNRNSWMMKIIKFPW